MSASDSTGEDGAGASFGWALLYPTYAAFIASIAVAGAKNFLDDRKTILHRKMRMRNDKPDR